MGNKINTNYEVREGEILSFSKNEHYNCLMLNMKISVFHQGYPPSKTSGGYEEQLAHLKEVFEVENPEDLIGKKFVALCSPCDVFCLYNPENNQFFSPQAKFFPEQYEEALTEIKKTQTIKFYDELDDFNTLMTGVVKAQKNPEAEKLIFANLMDSNQLKEKLEAKLPPTFKAKTKKI